MAPQSSEGSLLRTLREQTRSRRECLPGAERREAGGSWRKLKELEEAEGAGGIYRSWRKLEELEEAEGSWRNL